MEPVESLTELFIRPLAEHYVTIAATFADTTGPEAKNDILAGRLSVLDQLKNQHAYITGLSYLSDIVSAFPPHMAATFWQEVTQRTEGMKFAEEVGAARKSSSSTQAIGAILEILAERARKGR